MPSIDLAMPQEIHAVAFDAFSLYSENGESFSAKTLEDLGAQLLEISGDLQQLWYAMASLGALALTLEDGGAKEAAETLRELIAKQAPHFKPIMEELERESGEGRAEAAAAFNQMFGERKAKAAPKHDEAAPEGSVSLKSLLPNPALGGPRAAPRSKAGPPPPAKNPTEPQGPAPRDRGRPRRGRIDLQQPSGPGPRGPRKPPGR